MNLKTTILILAAAGFPILILIPAQVLLTLKAKKPLLQLLPPLLCLLAMAVTMVLLPEEGLWKLLTMLYLILLLILCGTGWVIAWSIKKSRRT